MLLTVIVPCYNEEGNLDLIVERILQTFAQNAIDGEIILVDDKSTDRTSEKIEELAARHGNVLGRYHLANRGIVEGWKTGLEAARGDYIVTIDADLQYLPEDIAKLVVAALDEPGYDLVQGWRARHESNHPYRDSLSRALSSFLNILFRLGLKDVKSGFILYRREAFKDILDYKGKYFAFQHLITVAARAKGYKVHQVPVLFRDRRAGESFIKSPLKFSLKALADIPKALVEFKFRKSTMG